MCVESKALAYIVASFHDECFSGAQYFVELDHPMKRRKKLWRKVYFQFALGSVAMSMSCQQGVAKWCSSNQRAALWCSCADLLRIKTIPKSAVLGLFW